jgi:ribosomal protein S18 acetylase RimI-like enzyme
VLGPHHERSAFDCGVEPLTRYLRERAGQDMRDNVAVCYVACSPDSPAVLGYATLSAATIELADLPQEIIRRLPRYPLLPAALIGHLAVDMRLRGQGVGEMLLIDMLRRCLNLHAQLGLIAVIVDAKDERRCNASPRQLRNL